MAVSKFAALARFVVVVLAMVSTCPVAGAVKSFPQELELLSSVMWQPLAHGNSYIYPPGIPAVLRRNEANRSFRIEQYFDSRSAISPEAIVPRVS